MAPRVINNHHIHSHPSDPLLLGNLMECVCIGLEHSIDLLSCDTTTAYNGQDRLSNSISPVSASELAAREYAKLHDDFIESLLQEQQTLQQQKDLQVTNAYVLHDASFPTHGHFQPIVCATSSESALSWKSPEPSLPPIGEITTLTPRKRRAVKLARRSPRRSPKRQVIPLPMPVSVPTSLDDTISVADDASLLSHFTQRTDDASLMSHFTQRTDDASLLSHFTQRALADPPFYMHDQCKLQKDKNKGDAVGSEICAVGKKACLEKMRQKMELLTQVALGKSDPTKSNDVRKQKKPSASMKRRKAKVSEETASYTETRSVIELRMGFLSMQYGILLRWDTLQTGKIVMVVLRKMCADSFYKKECTLKPKVSLDTKVWPFSWTDNHAIWNQRDATEVSLLEPPFRIAPVLDNRPFVLTIDVLHLADFDTNSTWSVFFTINGESQKIVHRHGHHTASKVLDWELPSKTVELDMEITLSEQKRSRNKRGRGKQIYPLHLLVDGDGDKLSILTPCGTLHMRIHHQSEYCRWLRRELEARGREVEVLGFNAGMENAIEDDEDDVEDSFWNFCGVW